MCAHVTCSQSCATKARATQPEAWRAILISLGDQLRNILLSFNGRAMDRAVVVGVAAGTAAAGYVCWAARTKPAAVPKADEPVEARAVLEFWFGGDLKHNYTTKWFASGAAQASADQTISQRFGKLLSAAERGDLDHWRATTAGRVALILVLDQFSRHVYRNQPRDPITCNDHQALELALQMVDESASLPLPWQVFALMPLRHSPTCERLERVMELMEDRKREQDASAELVRRFMAQTSRRLLDLQGEWVADLCKSLVGREGNCAV